MKNKISSEDQPNYNSKSQNKTIEKALSILESRLSIPENYITSPEDSYNYLKLKLSELEHEVFAVMFLDNRHGVICYQEMFKGTVNGASVYPREVLKEALKQNASAVIVAHNHPSGIPEPSQEDLQITRKLKEALELVEIRLLDHIIIGGLSHVSLAERGEL